MGKSKINSLLLDLYQAWEDYKEWEQDKSEFKKVQDKQIAAKAKMNDMIAFIEKFDSAF
jgi:hypothetical protein